MNSDDDCSTVDTETWRGQVPPLSKTLAKKTSGKRKKKSRVDNEPLDFLAKDAQEVEDLEDMRQINSYLYPEVTSKEDYERDWSAPPPKKRNKKSRTRLTMNDQNFQDYDLVLDNDIEMEDLEGSLCNA